MNTELHALARRMVWWKSPEDALGDEPRFLAQLMTFGTWNDWMIGLRHWSEDDFRAALINAPAGVFDARSWAGTGIAASASNPSRRFLFVGCRMLPDFKLDILPPRQRELWNEAHLAPSGFVLYGGTAIAMRLGHRKSVDFDFFSSEPFVPDELRRRLDFAHHALLLQSASNTLTLLVDGDDPVKLSYFGDLGHGQLASPDAALPHGVLVASAMDLLAAKLKVILQRAEAKDYLDIAALLEHGTPLAEGLAGAETLFGPEFQAAVSLRALSYFDDGDLPTLPRSVQAQLATAAAAVREIPTVARASEKLG